MPGDFGLEQEYLVEIEPTQAKPRSITELEPKMCLQGIIKETQLYGAVVDIGVEHDGMVHISQLAPTRINRVTDIVQPGDDVTVWVTNIDAEKGRIGLTMVKPAEVDWSELAEGKTYTGVVTRLEDYGAFVDIGAERPGLLHVRDMAAGYVRHPSEIMKVGDEFEVRILKADRRKRRIDLTLLGTEEEGVEEPEEPTMTAMEIALQRAQSRTKKKAQARRPRKASAPDLTEREDILARTLREHSSH
jgi:small subunit ribosomal protein S1